MGAGGDAVLHPAGWLRRRCRRPGSGRVARSGRPEGGLAEFAAGQVAQQQPAGARQCVRQLLDRVDVTGGQVRDCRGEQGQRGHADQRRHTAGAGGLDGSDQESDGERQAERPHFAGGVLMPLGVAEDLHEDARDQLRHGQHSQGEPGPERGGYGLPVGAIARHGRHQFIGAVSNRTGGGQPRPAGHLMGGGQPRPAGHLMGGVQPRTARSTLLEVRLQRLLIHLDGFTVKPGGAGLAGNVAVHTR